MHVGSEDPQPPRPGDRDQVRRLPGGSPPEDRPVTAHGQVLRLLLGVAVTCTAVTLAHSLAAWTNAEPYGVIATNPTRTAMIGDFAASLWTFLYLATGVAFAGWMFRVTRNNIALGASHVKWGPGWSWGGWFIPGANYVIPFLVLREIWRGSDPRRPPDTPLAAVPVWSGLTWFWVFWVVSGLVQGLKLVVILGSNIPLDATAVTASDLPRWLHLADAASYLLMIPSGFLAMHFTRSVELRQAQRRRTRLGIPAGS